MATLRCPNCSSEIKKPANPFLIVLAILAFLFIGGTMLIIVCLVAIAAIGTNANEELNRVNTIEAEATSEGGFSFSAPSQDTVGRTFGEELDIIHRGEIDDENDVPFELAYRRQNRFAASGRRAYRI